MRRSRSARPLKGVDRSNASRFSRALALATLASFGCTIGVEDHFGVGGPTPGGAFPDATTGMGPVDTVSATGDGDGDGDGVGSGSGDPGSATAVPDGDDGIPEGSTGGAALDDGDGDGDPGTTAASSAAGSSDDGAIGSSSAGGESEGDGSAAGQCATVAVEDLIMSSFSDCGDDARIGQYEFAAGVTCSQVCCMFGFDSCVHQAGQNNPFFCTPEGAPLIGGCNEVFPPNWMYQCLCE